MFYIPLRYFMPILIMFFGMSMIFAEVVIVTHLKKDKMLTDEKQYLIEIGNKLANDIERRELVKYYNKSELIRLFSYHLTKNVNVAKIYDDNFHLIFSTSPTKEVKNFNIDEDEIFKNVKQNVKSIVKLYDKNSHFRGYFPIYMPLQKGEVRRSRVGILLLEYDIIEVNKRIFNEILTSGLINGLIIITLSIILMISLYLFIFKRLNLIINATKELKNGNFSIRVNIKGKDELAEVGEAFNEMATNLETRKKELEKYKNHLEDRVKEEMDKRSEQGKLLIQQSRLAAMGEMIGNIAHQWRQPLNALSILMANIKTAYDFNRLDETYIDKSMAKSEKLIQKMSQTIDDFRNFFRPDKEKKTFSIFEVVESAISLLESSFKNYGIKININIDENIFSIGYPNEYSQVIMNILSNAKDSLINNKILNPTIDIFTIEDYKFAILTIRDNGGGIKQDVINKIFEPYFTTKEQGKGTGIGLYMSKIIIEEHMGGKIEVKNISEGVEFSIFIKKS